MPLCFFYFTAAGAAPFRLIFVETAWSEDGTDDQLPARKIGVKKSGVVHPSAAGYEKLAFEIKKVFSDFMVIETSQPMSPRRFEGNGIGLNVEETEFMPKKTARFSWTPPQWTSGAAYKIVLK